MTLHTLPSGIRPNSLPLLHPNALSCSPSQRRRCIFTREVFLPSWCMLFCCEIPSGADEFCLLFSKCDSVTSTQQMAAAALHASSTTNLIAAFFFMAALSHLAFGRIFYLFQGLELWIHLNES
ncbi:hypothetical protein MRB53_030861 [Persea americana]|uniref:Uncharacterized protein n=1 Tax=Persea americana TaxID=3435 RepID=A0ACC2KMI8_PERAE|nr:hypothetical protein MRB53_030861 [Persea americana]